MKRDRDIVSNQKKIGGDTVQSESLNLGSLSDTQLWSHFKQGDKNAFDLIYNRFFQPLCLYGDRICDDKNLVEDVVQDLFIYLWMRKEQLGNTDTIKFYLFRSLRRKLLRVIQQEKRRRDNKFIIKEAYQFQLSLTKPLVSGNSNEEEESRKKLATAISRLTDRQKEAVYLKFYNNLSFQEVASIMNIEVRSLYNLLGRTIDILRSELKNKELTTTTLLVLLLFW